MKNSKTLAYVLVFLFILFGFIAGGMEAEAVDGKGGLREDPLVTKSYVTAAVEEKFRSLETELERIRETVDRLQKSAAELKGTSFMEAGKTAVVEGQSQVALKNGPDEVFSQKGTLPKGTKVTIIDKSSDWYQIKTPSGLKGWVKGDFLKISN
ncbi:MAG: SH3 domain-containing protein [Clostridia bacterium]|nr:SH3 domain-containing protein [Clostridia bacterium]